MADITRPSIRLRPSEQRVLLLVGDALASLIALFSALYFWREYNRFVLLGRGFTEIQITKFQLTIQVPGWVYILPIIWLLLMVDLYEVHAAANLKRTFRGVAIAAFLGLLGYSLLFTFNQEPNALPRIVVGAFLIIASLLTFGWRSAYIRIYTSAGLMRRVLIIGAGHAGHTLVDAYKSINPPPFFLVGFIDDDRSKSNKKYMGVPVIGTNKRLLKIIDEYKISDIVVAITGEVKGNAFQAILEAQEYGVEVTRMPIMYEEMMGRVPIHHLESDWVVRSFVDQLRVRGLYEVIKRLMDVLGGLVGLAIFGFILPFATLATILDTGFPIFYSQDRLGSRGTSFKIYKLRTMKQNAEEDGKAKLASENDPRITRVGNFLRKTRLDELPQFWNVLIGEMSLVGPRAERAQLITQFQKEIPFYRARLLVKPGLTGWAQINYGYVADVKETAVKLEYDLYYIKHRSISMDIQIVLRTIGTVLRRGGR